MRNVSRIISAWMQNDVSAPSFVQRVSMSRVAIDIDVAKPASLSRWNAGCASLRWRRQ